MLTDRLSEIEATLARISNEISVTYPTQEEIQSARIEIFQELKEIKVSLDQIERLLTLIEKRIS